MPANSLSLKVNAWEFKAEGSDAIAAAERLLTKVIVALALTSIAKCYILRVA